MYDKIKYFKGDLFALVDKVRETKKCPIVITHIVNNIGAWGSGFVVPLGRKYPQAKERYRASVDWAKTTGTLGTTTTVIVEESPNVVVHNMMAQEGTGGVRPLRYNSLVRCLEDSASRILAVMPENTEIIAPAFGSGLAGGNWKFIEDLIVDCWIRKGINVTICYIDGTLELDPSIQVYDIDNYPLTDTSINNGEQT